MTDAPVPSAHPPHRVGLPVNVHRWDTISFLHWPYDPDVVARLLPEELQPHTYDGAAWVGVTPFFIHVRPPGLPVTPPGWAFPETNLRTYAVAPDGTVGVWFLRMEVTALWFVLTLRSLGLPYFRQRMSVDAGRDRIVYRSSGREGGHHVVVRPGRPLQPITGGPFDWYLTARWWAYHRRGVLLRTPVAHPPWELHAAEVEVCDVDRMCTAAGLPVPEGDPVVHHSPGIGVKVGPPRPVTG